MEQNKKISVIMLIIFIIVGSILVLLGIKNISNQKDRVNGYIEIEASYVDKHIYSSKATSTFEYEYNNVESDTLYSLIYSYTVDGKKYTISTDYGTNIIPKVGSTKTIKYNPDNPSEAIFVDGYGINSLFLFLGAIFVVFPIIIIVAMTFNKENNVFSKFFSFLVGLIFVAIGSSIYYIMCLDNHSLSPKIAFENSGITIIFPIILIILGLYAMITSVLVKRDIS